MGNFTFNQGNINTILLSVLRLSGSVPAFPADYTNPKVRIIHINGSTEVEDLAFINMTQSDGDNNWFHKFNISITAPFTKHLVIFETTIDGVVTQTTEEFKVVPPPGFIGGTGEFAVTLTVKNEITLQAISGALIRIFDKSNPSVTLATTETDASGEGTLFLDAGNYLVEFSKAGVIREVHDLIVFANGTHNVIGS